MFSLIKKRTGAAIMAAALTMNLSVAAATIPATAADTSNVLKFEFEDGTMTGTGGVKADDASASGGKYYYLESNSDTCTLKVTVPETGMYNITVRYQAAYGEKIQNLYVNGVDQGQLSFTSKEWTDLDCGTVKLNKGDNEIMIKSSWGWTNFDYLTVSSADLPEIKATQTTPCDPKATAETKSLMNYFAEVYGNHIISGQQEIYQYGPHGLETEFEYLKDLTGHYPAIRGFDYGNRCCELFGANDDGSTDRIIDWVKNKGGIATASFHLNVPKDFKNYTGGTVPFEQTTYSAKIDDKPATDFVTANAYKEGTKEYDYYRAALKRLATEFNKLEAEGVPVVWRPLHEAEGSGGENGSWFWWGKEGSAVYKELWKYTYKTLTEDFNCHNLIWEWNSYNYETSPDWYPGDEYVDIIGYDKYNCTVYLQENNWQPSLVHNDSAISSTFYGIMQKYNSAKMVSMAENDCFSTVDNLQSEKAGWLYFCTWYDGGSDNINFLSNPTFNTKEDTIAMYQSDYCLTLDEMPDDLYTREVGDAPIMSQTTTSTGKVTGTTVTTTTTVTTGYTFSVKKKTVALPEGSKNDKAMAITISAAPGASVGGGIGYNTGLPEPDNWAAINYDGIVGADGKLVVNVNLTDIPDDVTSAEVQVWWSNIQKTIDVPYEIEDCKVYTLGTGALERTLGDANCDGTVDISDAVLIMQNQANPEKYPISAAGAKNADVVANDGVTPLDALAIQMIEAKTIALKDLPIASAEQLEKYTK